LFLRRKNTGVLLVTAAILVSVVLVSASGRLKQPQAQPFRIRTIEAIGQSAEIQGQMINFLTKTIANRSAASSH
jgi:hypothetical protein